MIPRIDVQALTDPSHPDHAAALQAVRMATEDVGFMTVHNAPVKASDVTALIESYRAFFHLSAGIRPPAMT